jgi:hypothetical protein
MGGYRGIHGRFMVDGWADTVASMAGSSWMDRRIQRIPPGGSAAFSLENVANAQRAARL